MTLTGLLCTLLSVVTTVASQPPPAGAFSNDSIYADVDQRAIFYERSCSKIDSEEYRLRCADQAMSKAISGNLRYPAVAEMEGIQGKAVVVIVVERDGSLTNLKLAQDPGGGTGEEALRIVGLLAEPGTWTPAEIGGEMVRSRLRLTIPFRRKVPPPPPPPPSPRIGVEEIYKVVDEMPLMMHPDCEGIANYNNKKGCSDRKMLEFIYGNIVYPKVARINEVEGMAVVSFVVERNGTFTDAIVVRNPGAGIGEEALRVVRLMGTHTKWHPGRQGNRNVRVQFNLPIKFSLN